MVKDYLEYREGIMDFKTWIGSTRFILNSSMLPAVIIRNSDV